MKNRIALALTTVALAALLAPAAAVAQEAPAAPLAVSRAQGITWVDASLPAGEHSKVQIKILRETKRSTRLWQRCDFSFSGAATYRCGLDSGSGSAAAARSGDWVAKVFLDGAQVSKLSFSL